MKDNGGNSKTTSEQLCAIAGSLQSRHDEIGRLLEEEKKRPGGPRPEVISDLLKRTLEDHETTGEILKRLMVVLLAVRVLRALFYISCAALVVVLGAIAVLGVRFFGFAVGLKLVGTHVLVDLLLIWGGYKLSCRSSTVRGEPVFRELYQNLSLFLLALTCVAIGGACIPVLFFVRDLIQG